MPDLSILIVGDVNRTEFRDARAALEGLGRVVESAEIEEAEQALAGGEVAADVIVVAQAYPGQFSAEAIDRLRRLAPLARIVGLLGSWCEGEVRTGRPWPGAIRVYWHQWLPRVLRELSRLRDGQTSTWALPATAGEEERLLVLADEPWPRHEGLIAIHLSSFDMQDWLAAACRRAGYQTVWLRPDRSEIPEGIQAAIFDGDDARGQELEQLRAMAASLAPAPVIALLNFPRIEDRDRVLGAGAKSVLSKPLLVEDLLCEIERVVRTGAEIHHGGTEGTEERQG